MTTMKQELVFIPSPGVGHLISAVEFAKLILVTDQRLCISVLIMKLPIDFGVQDYVESLSSQPRLNFIDISLDNKTASELLSNSEAFLFSFIDGHKQKIKECGREIVSTCRIVGFVLDMFCISMMDVADELGVPSYVYFTSGASLLGLSLHFQALRNDKQNSITDDAEYLSIPCFENPYPVKVLPRIATDQTLKAKFFFHGVRRFKEAAKGIIVNTFFDLEPFTLRYLADSEILPPIYPVGPVVNFEEGGHGRSDPSEIESIMKWLDDQQCSSVVFLCFGSMGSFDQEQVKEIAIALERSGQRFLWSLRRPPPKGKIEMPSNYDNSDEVLPEGFLERTKGFGKIIGWAPQVAVLSHPAVGGFVSHCGWNSTLESVCCGVPIATWPLYAEQQMNAFLLVKELGLAVEIRMDYFKDFEGKNPVDIVSAEDIEGGIRRLMANGEENEVRKRMKEMKEKSKIAMKEGGSSYTSIQLLIEDVIKNIS